MICMIVFAILGSVLAIVLPEQDSADTAFPSKDEDDDEEDMQYENSNY